MGVGGIDWLLSRQSCGHPVAMRDGGGVGLIDGGPGDGVARMRRCKDRNIES